MNRLAKNLEPQRRTGWHSRPTPTLVALVLIASLLLAFYQVVSGAVRQAETRHQVSAAQADAAWRCNTPLTGQTRLNCVPAQHSVNADFSAAAEAQLGNVAHAAR